MSTPRAYIADCALTIPLVVGVGGWWGGASLAVNTLIASAAVLGNLALAAWVVGRFVASAAAGGASPVAGAALVLKQLATLPLALLGMALLGGEAVALGLTTVFAGLVVRAVVGAERTRDAALLFGAQPTESRC